MLLQLQVLNKVVYFPKPVNEQAFLLDVSILLLLNFEDGAVDFSAQLHLHFLSVQSPDFLTQELKSLLLLLPHVGSRRSGGFIGLSAAKQTRKSIYVLLLVVTY